MADKHQSESDQLKIVIVVIIVVLLAFAVLTSGLLSKDWKTLTIAAMGTDTLVTLQDRKLILKGLRWPSQALMRSIQVGGWTGSAFGPTPDVQIGSPGYVDINYNGLPSMGVTTVRISGHAITFTDRGHSILIDGKPTPLLADKPIEIKAAADLPRISTKPT